MRKADHTRIPLEAILFALGLIIGIAVSATAESRLVGAAGITQGTADSLYVKRDGSLDPDITGNLAVTVAGNPATLTNTTDAVASTLFEFYMNRGTGASNDELQLDFYFDDDASAKVKAGSWIIEGDDLGAKGGSYASATWRSGSAAPADIIKIDGVNNAVIANFFSIDDQLFTGLTGSVDQMDFKIANGLAMQITATQLRLLTTRNLAVDDSGHFQDRLNVGGTLATLNASAMFGTASTTQGSIPWPPMTSAQRNAIGSPVEGLAVWDATNNSPNWHNGTEWRAGVSVKASSFTPGSIVFADGGSSLTEDNSNLSWDDTDNIMTVSGIKMTGRLQGDKGADVASADEITLGTDGNYFDITGTTTIDHICKTGWQAGSIIVLQFDSSVTVTHNAGTPTGTEASILLAGAVDFSATVDDILQLVYDGVTFREVSRTVI